MSGIARPLALFLVAGTLMSVGRSPVAPHGAVAPPHHGAMHKQGAHSMRAMIMASAAVVRQNEIAAVPLTPVHHARCFVALAGIPPQKAPVE